MEKLEPKHFSDDPRHGCYKVVDESGLHNLGAGWELIRTLRTIEYQLMSKPIYSASGYQERTVSKSVRAPRIRFLVGQLLDRTISELRANSERSNDLDGRIRSLEYSLREAIEKQVKLAAELSVSKSYTSAQDFTLKKHQATIELLEKDIGKIREVVGSAKMKDILGR